MLRGTPAKAERHTRATRSRAAKSQSQDVNNKKKQEREREREMLSGFVWFFVKISATAARSVATLLSYFPFLLRYVASNRAIQPKKKVVILGSGFCGAFAARTLQEDANIEVTVVTPKSIFEFTPGIFTAVVDPGYKQYLQAPLKNIASRVHVVVGKATTVERSQVRVENETGKESVIPYDILLCATGSSYSQKVLKSAVLVDDITADGFAKSHARLDAAKTVLVIGGGIVGVELVAEIIQRYGETKHITLVQSAPRLVPRNGEDVAEYIQKTLYEKSKSLSIMLGRKIESVTQDRIFTTNAGEIIEADLAYFCAGPSPNTAYLYENFSSALTPQSFVRVNEHFQVDGHANIFAAGDIAQLREEKMAAYARAHAEVAAQNISKVAVGSTKLAKYKAPERIQGMIIGLGDRGVFINHGSTAMTGPLPASIKAIYERCCMIYNAYTAW